ncbi:MAG TPA: hypothetical protein VFL69_13515 [Marmoricola sp.]|nr:hypothetical protein [Marmoricola sp.]
MTSPPPDLVRLTALLGTAGTAVGTDAATDAATDAGTVADLVVDLAQEPPAVSGTLTEQEEDEPPSLAATELLLVRDVLDAPVYDVARGRLSRVGEVWLQPGPEGSWQVAGLEVGAGSTWHRLAPRARRRRRPGKGARILGFADVHLVSRRGHDAQLAALGSAVHRLDPHELAGLLTSLPVDMAADVVRRLPPTRVEDARTRLHPHVSARLARGLGEGEPDGPRRTRRTAGWRLNRPRRHEREAASGQHAGRPG